MSSEQGRTKALIEVLPDIGAYRLRFRARDALQLPRYPGSAWRGSLGQGLRRAVCVTRQPTCNGCLLRDTCTYATLFEAPTRTPDGRADNPLPYALVPDLAHSGRIASGQEFELEIRLWGRSNTSLPYIIHAMRLAGERGIGSGHGRYQLLGVSQLPGPDQNWQSIYEADAALEHLPPFAAEDIARSTMSSETLELQLRTPLRMKRKGRLVGPREFEIQGLCYQIVHRLESLARRFGSKADPELWQSAYTLARSVELVSSDLYWRDWTRYSSRQETHMQMGGLMGRVTLGGPAAAALLPLMEVGQWTLIGKTTSMGLGRYRLATPATLPHPDTAARKPIMDPVGRSA